MFEFVYIMETRHRALLVAVDDFLFILDPGLNVTSPLLVHDDCIVVPAPGKGRPSIGT